MNHNPAISQQAISATDLEFSYHSHATNNVLGPLSLTIARGKLTSILGPSGCGKSTLLRLFAGLLAPSHGVLSINDMPGGAPPRFSFVFQDPTLLAWSSVQDNVSLPLKIAGISPSEASQKSFVALESVGLTNAINKMPHTLSGGMRMRVSLARALVTKPDVILLDEPFAALDELTRHRLDEELRALVENTGITAIFVTHNVSESVFLADDILVLKANPGLVAHRLSISDEPKRDPKWRRDAAFHKHCEDLAAIMLETAS